MVQGQVRKKRIMRSIYAKADKILKKPFSLRPHNVNSRISTLIHLKKLREYTKATDVHPTRRQYCITLLAGYTTGKKRIRKMKTSRTLHSNSSSKNCAEREILTLLLCMFRESSFISHLA
jgi:hypothetical protein